jgi:hypothetical protein
MSLAEATLLVLLFLPIILVSIVFISWRRAPRRARDGRRLDEIERRLTDIEQRVRSGGG